MSPLSRLSSWAKGLFSDGVSASGQKLLSGVITGGQAPTRGTRELLLSYKRIPQVRSVVHRIAYDVAGVPFRVLRAARAPGGAKRYKNLGGGGFTGAKVRREMMQDAVASGDLVEVDNHPFLDLMQFMNPALRGQASRAVTGIWEELAGESFWIYERNGMANVCEAWPIPPHWVLELPHNDFPNFRVSWLGFNKVLPAADVCWQKYPDADNPYARGAGVGTALADELDVDEFATKHIRNWFHNSAMPAAIAALEGASGKEVELFQADWENRFKGAKKAHQLKFTNGKLSLQQLSDTFKDQQLVELRRATRDICRETFNMPPELVGILENSNRATIDAAYFLYSTGVLCPRLDFRVSNLQPLLEEWDDGLVLDYVSPVPEDREFKKSVMVALPTNYTVNEHRALAGQPPLEDGGDELYEAAGISFGGFGGDPLPPGKPEPEPGEDPSDVVEDEDEDETEPKFVKSLRGRSLRRKDVSIAELTRILEGLRPERISVETAPVFGSRLERWGQRILNELGVDVHFDVRNPMVRQHLEALSGTKIQGITDVTRDALGESFSEGVALGEGISELSERVESIFGEAMGYRAQRIARTEVIGSSNFANYTAFTMSGVVAQKEWLAVQKDGNTRDEHRALDGNTTLLNEKFTVDGHSSHYPGGFGVAHLDINCRCSVLPVVDNPDKAGGLLHVCSSSADRLAVWKLFDTRAAAWERVAVTAFRRGFKRQKADILEALARVG